MLKTTAPSVSLLAAAAFATLSACGGGGGGGGGASPPPPPPPPPAGPSGPDYTPGVFEEASTFRHQCETPRSGTNIEGDPFPDEQGSLVEELFWLRSWTNETYLWPDEVPDLDPYDYNNRVTYFDRLKTSETTASGAPKDDFHFSQPTEEYLRARNSEPEPGYGANFVLIANTPPREVRVIYSEPDSPAAEEVNGVQNLIRGSEILTVDGVDVVNANTQAEIDTINAGLFPDTAGETHTFTVQDPGASDTRTISLTAGNITRQPVQSTTVLDTPGGKVGYIHFTTFSPFSSEEQIRDAMQTMASENVTDLVLDLRYNGGGLLAVASQLSYMIAGDAATSGRAFEQLRFNAAAGNINPVTGNRNDPIPFYTTGQGFSVANGTALPSLDLDRVYVLSTGRTCSASESVINALRGVDIEVVLIGDTTCGKPFGFYPTGNCGRTYYSIQFQGVNDKGFGDYADGFVPQNATFDFGVQTPGCRVSDELTEQLGQAGEPLLAAALQYRDDGTCPAPPASSSGEKTTASADSRQIDDGVALDKPAAPVFETNRDMTMPGEYNERTR
ncbi:S41 family peptidase [Henriciella sp.]|uniref:S41 family peptidase n=1 Tax=Henriciella sp. TaxID=1968823 RepID=UPI0026396FB7|nr:S41 family peptidase [Henriciella sp.]